jgi:molybdenum cofactor cytidylyltransferase
MVSNIGAIILAAGNSSRMGKCKFLLPMFNGVTFIENIIQVFTDYGLTNIVVVTQEKYMTDLEELCIYFPNKPFFVVNDCPENERFYSLQIGIKALENCSYSFIHNADSPFIDLKTLELLTFNKEEADYICPVYEGSGGHPILVNKSTMEHLLNFPINAILKEALSEKQKLNVLVDNKLITVDIDTPEEYKQFFNLTTW